MRRLIAAVFILLLTISLVRAQETATPDALVSAPRGTITGHITNGTAASTIPADMKVTLFIRDSKTKQTTQQAQTTSATDGSFSFTDVPLSAEYEYAAAAGYRQRAFSSDFVAGNSAGLDLTVTVYELTEDVAVLSIKSSKIQVTVSETTMEVQQAIEFSNHSDRVFTGSTALGDGRYPSVIISLPPGSVVVGYDTPSRYQAIQQSYTVLDTAPVLPGDNHTVVVVYILPYDGNPAVIEQPFNYPFEGNARLLVSPETVAIKSGQFAEQGSETINDHTYKAYDAALKLPAGDVLRYEIGGKISVATTAVPSTGSSGIGILVAIILIAIGVVVLALYFRGRQSATPSKDQLINALTQQIETLDRQHQTGELNHDIWHRQRGALQARLSQLTGEEASEQP